MKSQSEKQKFIELRAKGLSFEKIAQQLHVSKPTLMKWNEDYRKEITNLRYFEMESLIDQYGIAKRAKVEALAVLLEKALNELRNRSFEDVSAKDLILMILQLDTKIKAETSGFQYLTGEYLDEMDNITLNCLKEKTLSLVY